MDLTTLTDRFYTLVAPDLPNEWDVDDALEAFVDSDEEAVALVFGQIPVIWPVSNSLCYDYLGHVQAALDCFDAVYLSQWVNETLDHYEKGGLRAAQRFMDDVEQQFVCRLRGEAGLRFREVEGRLLPYIRGLAGRDIDLTAAQQAYTDTLTIFLPKEISTFQSEADNFLLYKCIATFQWCFIELGTFFPVQKENQENRDPQHGLLLDTFFAGFSDPLFARDLYHFLETVRVASFLHNELPGLMRSAGKIFPFLSPASVGGNSAHDGLITLQRQFVEDRWHVEDGQEIDQCAALVRAHSREAQSAMESVALTSTLYNLLIDAGKEYEPVEPLAFQGRMRLRKVLAGHRKRLQEQEERFVDALATFLLTLPPGKEHQDGEKSEQTGAGVSDVKSDIAMVFDTPQSATEQDAEATIYLTINNEQTELSEDLKFLAREVVQDLGSIPERYISSAAGKAGTGVASQAVCVPGDGAELSAPIVYDEWDYRRNGFRKNWCVLSELEIPIIRSTFIRATMTAYQGQIMRLRHQFEMMRTSERFVRRQRDGDEIDLDALVESLADTQAGLPPSDRLFIRLKRDERDIAALFLVDMSNSTEGWVGTAIKEALVLICEAMEKLGDRYGIYGFSGMRRLRCETFHIKHLEEPYNEDVRQRIGSIAPREYTRMAPAIRHMTSLLKGVDAKVRLLITLSDGKPEDYDDYKGEYAIEDTRHALLEAKSAGIHPFCITIDQHAHEYMAHMYGEVNYIFINDVKKLPARMPEIYRVLTT